MNKTEEVNFDGLIGPTHNYGGLSFGNKASMLNKDLVSNPRQAALQGLEKMASLMRLGIKQAVLPPQERPFIPLLRTVGYEGPEEKILEKVWKENPQLLLASSSAACMWAANAATISPSFDSEDRRLHITPANLVTQFHRSFEAPTTAMILHRIFNHPTFFHHHYPLPLHLDYADEGAANHTRFCKEYGGPGVQLFVYGRAIQDGNERLPRLFPARQTDQAARALARLHRLSLEQVVFAQQSPEAIDAGVFHNDVIAVGNQHVFLYHEKAFLNTPVVINELKDKIEKTCQIDLYPLLVAEDQVSLAEAVRTYLFNSQIVTLNDQTMVLIAPQECFESLTVRQFLEEMLKKQDNPIKKIIYQDVRQSMQNGGGPACLRLRVVLNPKELAATLPSIFLTEELYQRLKKWIEKYYRETLHFQDLADPQLLSESRRALDDLTAILQLGPIYPFQMQRLNRD